MKKGIPSVWIKIEGITDKDYNKARLAFKCLINSEKQISDAVSKFFQLLVKTFPSANPSDLWQHVVYRQFLHFGNREQQWKRISGYALERVFTETYCPRSL